MYIETFLKKYFFYTLVRIFLNSVHTHKTNKQNKTKKHRGCTRKPQPMAGDT